jgi:hypothetical protein
MRPRKLTWSEWEYEKGRADAYDMMCFDEKVEKVEKVGFVFSSESRERT